MAVANQQYQRGIAAWSDGCQEQALVYFEQALALDPGIAELPFLEGLERVRAGEFAEAEGWLWISHLFRPEHAPTLTCLGDTLRRLGRVGEALELLQKAALLAPDRWEAHSDLGLALTDLDRLEEARAALAKAIDLHGLDARLAVNLANVEKSQGHVDEALRVTEEALRLDPSMVAAHVNRAHLLLLQGRFEEGWNEYEWRPTKRLPADRLLEHNPWAGKTVLLHQEQGAGDLIQFIRYAEALSGAHVTVSCDERFMPAMRCVRGVTDAVSWTEPHEAFDLEANVMSLPRILNLDFKTFAVPYLSVDPERINAWRERLSEEGRFRVGLVWGGNPANPVERKRGLPPSSLALLLTNPNIAFYSLQQGPQKTELPGVVDLAAECGAVMEAAAAMMNLDLIITTDTMPAHLAGALGRPVWVLLHSMADWRWMLHREDSPWYPSMRLFRQPTSGDWDSVVRRVADALLTVRGGES